MPKTTVGRAMEQIQDMEERIAITRALIGYLRTRYLSRDSMMATSKITNKGKPVSEASIRVYVEELEEAVEEADRTVKHIERRELEDG